MLNFRLCAFFQFDIGYMQLQDKPATLVGKLTAQPNSRQDSQGQVFFVDDSGTLPCQVTSF